MTRPLVHELSKDEVIALTDPKDHRNETLRFFTFEGRVIGIDPLFLAYLQQVLLGKDIDKG